MITIKYALGIERSCDTDPGRAGEPSCKENYDSLARESENSHHWTEPVSNEIHNT